MEDSKNLTTILFNTCRGWMEVVGSAAGLRRVILPQESLERLTQLSDEFVVRSGCFHVAGEDCSSENGLPFSGLIMRLRQYLAGELVGFPDKLDLVGATDFQKNVWQAVKSVSYAETRCYAWVARELGLPGAARAVGQALAKNPLPVVIPCHRIVRSDGSLGGYNGGLGFKKILLDMEGAHITGATGSVEYLCYNCQKFVSC